MTASYELKFDTKPYGFRIVGDDQNKNAIVKAILNPILAKSLYVGSWITQINDIVVETWDFSAIISVLREAELPVMIKFRQCLILSGTDQQLISHEFTPNLNIEVSDTGKEPSQQKQGKPFVAYNLLVSDTNKIPLKWQLWKRYNHFEKLHKELLRIVPDLSARLPPKQHFGRFKPGFIQQRRVQLQKYMDDIKHHPGIVNSTQFRNFLIPMSFNTPSSKQNFKYNNPSEMKPILLEIRDRLETLCDGIEMNNMDRENILSSVRYLLSIVSDTCTRTKDPMDATTVSRSFTTGLPNNNAFIKQCDDIFYGKYLLNEHSSLEDKMDEEQGININHIRNQTLEWALLLIDIDDFSKVTEELSAQSSDPEMGNNLLRHMSQTIYSCVDSEHQKVFHLDADTFSFLTPIDETNDIVRLAGTLLTRIRTAPIPIDLDRDKLDMKEDQAIINGCREEYKKGWTIDYNIESATATVYLTVSMGISMLRHARNNNNNNNNNKDNDELILDTSPADWIQRADLSLQRAKKKGKNCIGPLLEHDARPQDFRNDITSQWFEAAAKGEHGRIMEMVKTGFAVDTLQISYDSDTKLTALMTAAIYDHSEVGRTLLRYNADINLHDEYGRTSLIHAAQNGSHKTAKVLLESGKVCIDESDKTQKTALMYAALQRHYKIVTLLLNRDADVNMQDSQGLTALMYAVQSESRKVVNIVLDAHPDLTLQDEFGETCLMFASKKKYHNACARMIQNGAHINSQNKNGLSSLMWSSFLGHLSVVNTLLTYNADVQLETQHGSTALSFASESGHLQIALQLIKRNADINHVDHDGDTPLHCAAYNGHEQIIQVLHRNGASIDVKNKENKTALDYARHSEYKDVIQYLQPLMPSNDTTNINDSKNVNV